jgi:segregation and condensation protein B
MTSETPENPEKTEAPEASSDASSEASTEVSTEAGPGLRASLEAILLVADEPVPVVVLAQVLERPRNEVEAGGSTLERIARRWSSVSSVTGRRSG